MIEVNLLKGFSPDATSATSASGGDYTLNTFSTGQSVVWDKKDFSIKLIILLIPLLGMYIYEMYDEGVGKESLRVIRAEVTQLSSELDQYGKQVQEVKRIQEEKKRLNSRVETIFELSKERLTNAKALNALHDLVPPEAWLTSLKIKNGEVEFEGQATEDLVVSQFLRNLQESIYFKDIKLVATEERSTTAGVRKTFSIDAKLGGN
jgi:type IV pilus assembly protein PilN